MTVYYLFFNCLAIYFIINGIMSYLYPKILRKTKYRHKGRKFILTRLFGTSSAWTWRLFWGSLLFIIIGLIKGEYQWLS